LEKAVDMGYKVTYIYEAWHFPKRMEGIFEAHANTWLKITQEASRWPEWVGDNEERDNDTFVIIMITKESYWIMTRSSLIPVFEVWPRLMLNSMWGKFVQRLNTPQVKQFCDPVKFHELLESEKNNISLADIVNQNLVEV